MCLITCRVSSLGWLLFIKIEIHGVVAVSLVVRAGLAHGISVVWLLRAWTLLVLHLKLVLVAFIDQTGVVIAFLPLHVRRKRLLMGHVVIHAGIILELSVHQHIIEVL